MNQKISATVVGLVLVVSICGLSALSSRHDEGTSNIERGRAVYISEGCIHCHSQYSRPESKDIHLYGPQSALPSQNRGPVLVGNRRQGPDLSTIGLRRVRDWNRRHLIDPAKLTPGSRMPRYKHLFDRKSYGKGEALLDYLESLKSTQSIAVSVGSDPET